MNGIKRYKLVATESARNVIECDDGHWVHYSNVEQLQARIKDLESAERTLINLGYENKGGEMWKPPIGKRPNFSLIDSLNERIKELETEKETRYQEGKSEIISKLINDVPNPEYIDEFIEPFRVYESFSSDYEIVSWNTDKLKQYFDVDRNFTSSYEKFQLMFDHFFWAAMALEDNCMKKKDFINYIVRDDTTHNLENYIKHKINEFKAQGIEEAIKKADGETYIYPIGTDALNQQYRSELKCYAETLSNNYEVR